MPDASSPPPDAADLTLDGALGLADAARVAEGRALIAIGPAARARVAAARDRLDACVAERRVVYGVTTGFGPLADRVTPPDQIRLLQENLINHLASGVGRPLPWAAARATALARLNSLLQGWSGASEGLVGLLTALLNSPLAPSMPEKGTVGASGDLTPLAHMALALMGRGGFLDPEGRPVSAGAAFAALGRDPLTLEARDGLALVNGTSAMTGIAVLNAAGAARLIRWAEALTVAVAELLRGRTEAWSDAFSAARPHPGQAATATALRRRASGSTRLVSEPAALSVLSAAATPHRADRAAQDAYSLRCAPQVLGAARDALAWHDAVAERELNSATDNPILPEEGPPALHGGNFMGQHVGLASDALANAIVVAAGLAERQIARLTDERLNEGLPPFLHRGPAGLNSGFMGAQVTATALVAEMRARGGSASAQSISTNGANQDVVSMGTIAARAAAAQIEDARRVLAILALAVAQGVDIVSNGAGAEAAGFGRSTAALWRWVRARAPEMPEDRPLGSEIEAVAAAIAAGDPG
jgi:tyrosine ammonia-lyase